MRDWSAALYSAAAVLLLATIGVNALTWRLHFKEHDLYRVDRASLPAVRDFPEHPRRHGYHLVARFRLPFLPNGPTFAELGEVDTMVLNGDAGLVEVWARPRVDGTPAPAWWSEVRGE